VRGEIEMGKGMVVMVTGASMGLGRALAIGFAKEGAQLAICARGREALQEVEVELKRLGRLDLMFMIA